jgi:hypothetical protein
MSMTARPQDRDFGSLQADHASHLEAKRGRALWAPEELLGEAIAPEGTWKEVAWRALSLPLQ